MLVPDIADDVVEHQSEPVLALHLECALAAVGPRHRDEKHFRISEIALGRIDLHRFLDFFAAALRSDHPNCRITLLPDLRVEPMVVVGHDQEGGRPEFLDPAHLVLVECDRVEHYQPAAVQPHQSHPPGKLHQGHPDLAGDGQDAVGYLGQTSVRKDFPFLERRGHRPAPRCSPEATTIEADMGCRAGQDPAGESEEIQARLVADLGLLRVAG